jgi:hypothetical protein
MALMLIRTQLWLEDRGWNNYLRLRWRHSCESFRSQPENILAVHAVVHYLIYYVQDLASYLISHDNPLIFDELAHSNGTSPICPAQLERIHIVNGTDIILRGNMRFHFNR